MVYDLALLGRQAEMTAHLIIVEGTDTGRTRLKCLCGEIQTLANSRSDAASLRFLTFGVVTPFGRGSM
jgi:hypothetical protein